MENILVAIRAARTQTEVDDLVTAHLINCNELENAREETYEETAARLDCRILRTAARRWWELAEYPQASIR